MSALAQAQFEQEVLSSGSTLQFLVYPFFSDEFKDSGKVVTFSDKVERTTFVQEGNERIGMVVPFKEGDSFKKVLKRCQEDLKHYIGMSITIFSLYDFDQNKVDEVHFYREFH